MTIQITQAHTWFTANESNLLKFEDILLDTMDTDMEIGVVYLNDKSVQGRLHLKSCADSGELYAAQIELNTTLQQREAILARIIIIAHELGHFLDLTESFDSNVNDYHETEDIIREQDAWSFAYVLLDTLGFDEYAGQMGWIAFRNIVSKTLSTYYVNEHTSRHESVKKAISFVNHLVMEKFAAPGEMSLV